MNDTIDASDNHPIDMETRIKLAMVRCKASDEFEKTHPMPSLANRSRKQRKQLKANLPAYRVWFKENRKFVESKMRELGLPIDGFGTITALQKENLRKYELLCERGEIVQAPEKILARL